MNDRRNIELWLADELAMPSPDRNRVAALCAEYLAVHTSSQAVTVDSLVPVTLDDEVVT